MPVNETVILDLDAIVKDRFGDKIIPKPVLAWLKHFIHQDHLNGYLKQGWLGVEFAEKALEFSKDERKIVQENQRKATEQYVSFEKKNEMKQASSQEGGKKTTEEKEQNLQNGL